MKYSMSIYKIENPQSVRSGEKFYNLLCLALLTSLKDEGYLTEQQLEFALRQLYKRGKA